MELAKQHACNKRSLGVLVNSPKEISFRWYAAITALGRRYFLLIAVVAFPRISPAQQGDNFSDLYAKADAKRNAAYSLAYPKLTPPVQEILIRSELAWTDFSDKEKTLLNALRVENLVSEDFAHAHSIVVVDARTTHLQAFFVDYNINYPPQYTPQNSDQELNRTYAECSRQMSEGNKAVLLSSERAWITYRDADIAAVVASNADPTWKNAAIVQLTVVRTEQLTSIIASLKPASIANIPVQEFPPPLLISPPDSESAKVITDFQNDAKAVLNSLASKKDDPFFKKADSIKNAPQLPSDISDQISKLDARYVEISSKPLSAEILEPAVNECATVELLASWSKFTQQLKAGNRDDAGFTIQSALRKKPKDLTADYLPIWRTAESWRDVYLNDESIFDEHIQKAKSFADLGKTSAAIKEYQAAYEIIEDSTIPEKVKKLREQSLGL